MEWSHQVIEGKVAYHDLLSGTAIALLSEEGGTHL
jgi:hypothetical protein